MVSGIPWLSLAGAASVIGSAMAIAIDAGYTAA